MREVKTVFIHKQYDQLHRQSWRICRKLLELMSKHSKVVGHIKFKKQLYLYAQWIIRNDHSEISVISNNMNKHENYNFFIIKLILKSKNFEFWLSPLIMKFFLFYDLSFCVLRNLCLIQGHKHFFLCTLFVTYIVLVLILCL